jgi:protein tyrosine/serine phosphatase
MTTPQNPPLPTPPFHPIPNINNLRDAALHPLTTSTGAPLRPGILFRSAEVSHLDIHGWTSLSTLGIAHVFDLRSLPEVAKGWAGIVGRSENGEDSSDVLPGWLEAMQQAGVKRTWTPVFSDKDYSPERLAERYTKYMSESEEGGFVEAYKDIAMNAGDAFGVIFRYLAGLTPGEERRGALVHCTAGKDRTGMFFGVLLDFLGVNREVIADEYHRTEMGLRHVREEVVERLLASPLSKKMLLDMAGEKEGGEVSPEMRETGRKAALRMIGARKESMLRSLDMLDREFGGAEMYMREKCGLGDEELEALRRNLVVQE